MGETVAGLLARHAADPDRVFAVLEDGTAITYAQQLARSRLIAAGLAQKGIGAGDRVHVQLGNCHQFIDVWFATALGGAVLVPTNPQSSEDELAHVLHDSGAAISLRTAAEVDTLAEAGGSGSAVPEPADQRPERLAAILYTSGTTSRAKGVRVTDGNYVVVGRAVADHLDVTAADRWLIVLPLFHANAQYYCVMSALVRGASVALAGRFSASGWGSQAHRMDATLASLFAAPVRMILAQPGTPDDRANRLRVVLFAQNLHDEEARGFEDRFGTRLLQLYGMTETVLPPTMNPLDESRRWDSIGRPLPGVRVDLLDTQGRPVQSGDVGEIVVSGRRGVTVADGYWNNAAATAEVFTEGGLRTGDLARRDDEGFLYFVDRAKDMIKRSGENVSAGEVERVAGEHPAVAECAAVGVPDPIRDEAIKLVVVLRPGHDATGEELIEWCRDRLSPFKVPSFVSFVDALPRTSVGKIRKAELRTHPANSTG
jgi:crotonobetaine/carnitine-CoA ligase